jgi:uncharacterized protein YecE (DUF72 family)
MGKIYIGTSGWSYKHWIGTFYPEEIKDSEQFSYYLRDFQTVELNSSFYHLPSKETFVNWRKKTPADFLFAVKASRFITHMKKLSGGKETIADFFRNVSGLKEKLGSILFQLPPGWKVNAERLQEFLKSLPKKYRYTFEFRNATWYTDEVFDLLKKYNCAFCIYELEHHQTPMQLTADFVYVRLHGPEGKYAGNYSESVLKKWADQCNGWKKSGKDVFVYFDNDQLGYAAFNAITLKKLVRQK